MVKVKIKRVVKILPVLSGKEVTIPTQRKPGKSKSTNSILDNTFWRMERDGVTQSMIALFALCPMKAHYKLIEGIEPDRAGGTSALDFGSFFHEALDRVYSEQIKPTLTALPKVIKDYVYTRLYTETKASLIDQVTDTKDLQQFEITYGVCRTLLERYFTKWQKEDSKIKWIDIERVFSFPYKLRDGTVIQIKGKFDGVFRNSKGELWLFETKTKSQIAGNHIMEKIGFDLQVMVYCLAMKHVYGEYPKGVLYNLVKRPGQQYSGSYYKKPESIPQYLERIDKDIEAKVDEYFVRYQVSIAAQEIETWTLQDFDYIIERLYVWQQGGIPNFRNSGSCSMWNRPCEYLSICSNNDRGGYTQRKMVFPELDGSE